MNTFWLAFLDASIFAALFVAVFIFGVYIIGRATRNIPVSKLNWDLENLSNSRIPAQAQKLRTTRPSPVAQIPRSPSPGLEL